MPKASMDKYGNAMARQDKIRPAREFWMQSEPVAETVKDAANPDFRLRIL